MLMVRAPVVLTASGDSLLRALRSGIHEFGGHDGYASESEVADGREGGGGGLSACV